MGKLKLEIMEARLYLLAHGLDDLALNSSSQLKGVGKRVYTSDMMEKYAQARVAEETERIRFLLKAEGLHKLAAQVVLPKTNK